MKLMWKRAAPPVVTAVQDQTAQAAELARIAGQDMLTDPRTNPAVRPLLDRLRDEQHRLLLEAEHGRAKRRHRVEDRHRSEAELTLGAILQAKQASSPARSVLALHRGRGWFMGGSLAASVALSVGSAFGVGHLADDLGAPKVTGWVAEVGMVGLSTITILYLAHLFRHDWRPSPAHRVLFGFLAVGPLLASVIANAYGAGPVGVACSVGAALFGVFSHLVSDNSAGALRKKAGEVGREDERALRAVAVGEDLFSVPTGDTEPVPSGEHSRSAHKVATPAPVDTSGSGHRVGTAEPTSVPTGEHKPSGHNGSDHNAAPAPVATGGHSEDPTGAPGPVPTVAVSTPKAVTPAKPTTAKQPAKPTKPKAKRRSRDEIRAALQAALKEHYDNGGGEPQVKPLAEKIDANRRIVRELLDEMNVRPMIRKAV